MCPQGALEGIGQWEWDIGDRISGSEHAQKGETTDLIAGTLAALGASVCCVSPLVLVALGIGGSCAKEGGRRPFKAPKHIFSHRASITRNTGCPSTFFSGK